MSIILDLLNITIWIGLFLLLVASPFFIIVKIIKKIIKSYRDKKTNPYSSIDISNEPIKSSSYNNYLKQNYLMTKTETYFYQKLKEYLSDTEYTIFSKVRVLDLVVIVKGHDYMSSFNKVRSKHIDFVICDPNTKIICAIELNDSSHNKEDRISRDAFIYRLFQDIGLRFYTYTPSNKYNFDNELSFLKYKEI